MTVDEPYDHTPTGINLEIQEYNISNSNISMDARDIVTAKYNISDLLLESYDYYQSTNFSSTVRPNHNDTFGIETGMYDYSTTDIRIPTTDFEQHNFNLSGIDIGRNEYNLSHTNTSSNAPFLTVPNNNISDNHFEKLDFNTTTSNQALHTTDVDTHFNRTHSNSSYIEFWQHNLTLSDLYKQTTESYIVRYNKPTSVIDLRRQDSSLADFQTSPAAPYDVIPNHTLSDIYSERNIFNLSDSQAETVEPYTGIRPRSNISDFDSEKHYFLYDTYGPTETPYTGRSNYTQPDAAFETLDMNTYESHNTTLEKEV